MITDGFTDKVGTYSFTMLLGFANMAIGGVGGEMELSYQNFYLNLQSLSWTE